MCFVYIINFCKGNINTYINFESSYSITYFFLVRILDTFFLFFIFILFHFRSFTLFLNLFLCFFKIISL